MAEDSKIKSDKSKSREWKQITQIISNSQKKKIENRIKEKILDQINHKLKQVNFTQVFENKDKLNICLNIRQGEISENICLKSEKEKNKNISNLKKKKSSEYDLIISSLEKDTKKLKKRLLRLEKEQKKAQQGLSLNLKKIRSLQVEKDHKLNSIDISRYTSQSHKADIYVSDEEKDPEFFLNDLEKQFNKSNKKKDHLLLPSIQNSQKYYTNRFN